MLSDHVGRVGNYLNVALADKSARFSRALLRETQRFAARRPPQTAQPEVLAGKRI